MKNILNYYYHIIIDDDSIKSNEYFSYNHHLFCLYKYDRNIDEIDSLVSLNNYLLNMNIKMNKIIFNIENRPLTYYEGEYYVLILVNYKYDNYFNFKSVLATNGYPIIERNNWGYLWSSKVDYFEYQMKHIEKKYPLIDKTFNYYIGLSENAIMYFNMLKLENVKLYVGHRRIKNDKMYNPCELVIDYKVRDIAGYIKKAFFNGKMNIMEIKEYLMTLDLDNIDYILLYVRMLFPSYYFDKYEKIVNNHLDEQELLPIIEKCFKYEELLYEIYIQFRKKVNLIGIDWINKKYM